MTAPGPKARQWVERPTGRTQFLALGHVLPAVMAGWMTQEDTSTIPTATNAMSPIAGLSARMRMTARVATWAR